MINIDEFGTLNKRIIIKEYRDIEDDYGMTHNELADVIRCWARIEPMRARYYEEVGRDKSENTVKITIRYRKGIRNDMLIMYAGKLYEVNTIIDPLMAHVKLELMCSLKDVKDNED